MLHGGESSLTQYHHSMLAEGVRALVDSTGPFVRLYLCSWAVISYPLVTQCNVSLSHTCTNDFRSDGVVISIYSVYIILVQSSLTFFLILSASLVIVVSYFPPYYSSNKPLYRWICSATLVFQVCLAISISWKRDT